MKFLVTLLLSVTHADNILMIGDSGTCGSFGRSVLKNLSSAGNNVTVYCTDSSEPYHWVNGRNPDGHLCKTMSTAQPTQTLCDRSGITPNINTLLARHKGSRIIVALGKNSLLSTNVSQNYVELTKAINRSGTPCQWVGAPHIRADQARGFNPATLAQEETNLKSFNKSLETTVTGTCSFVDIQTASAPKTPGNETADGVHRTTSAGEYIAQQITPTLQKAPPPPVAPPPPAPRPAARPSPRPPVAPAAR